MSELRPDAVANRELWTQKNAEYTDAAALRAWAKNEVTWGVFGWSERELNALGDVAGLDVVELGCGTAYFSAWLARRGARVVGVDPTPAQLETARRFQAEFGLTFPLHLGDAEPGSIRGDLAVAMPDNLVHGSDSPESAEREIALWFSDDELV